MRLVVVGLVALCLACLVVGCGRPNQTASAPQRISQEDSAVVSAPRAATPSAPLVTTPAAATPAATPASPTAPPPPATTPATATPAAMTVAPTTPPPPAETPATAIPAATPMVPKEPVPATATPAAGIKEQPSVSSLVDGQSPAPRAEAVGEGQPADSERVPASAAALATTRAANPHGDGDQAGTRDPVSSSSPPSQESIAPRLEWTNTLGLPGLGSLALSPDGKWLAAKSGPTVVVLDSETLKACMLIVGESGGGALDFSPDGSSLAVPMRSVLQVHTSPGYLDVIALKVVPSGGLSWSADSQCWIGAHAVFSGDHYEYGVDLSDVTTGKRQREILGGKRADITAVSSDRSVVAIASKGEYTVQVIDLVAGAVVRILRGHSAAITALAVSPDGGLVASASEDRNIRVWSLASGQCLSSVEAGGVISLVAFDRAGDSFAAAYGGVITVFLIDGTGVLEDGSDIIRTLVPGSEAHSFWIGRERSVYLLSWTPQADYKGRMADFAKPRTVWSSGLEPLWLALANTGSLYCAYYDRSSDSADVLSIGSTRLLAQSNPADGYCVAQGGRSEVGTVSHNGRYLVASHVVYGTTASVQVVSVDASTGCLSPYDRGFEEWYTRAARALLVLDLPTNLAAVCFSPDDSLLAMAYGDTIAVYATATWTKVSSWGCGANTHVLSLAISSDNKTLLSGIYDPGRRSGGENGLYVWSLETSARASEPRAPIERIAYPSTDSRYAGTPYTFVGTTRIAHILFSASGDLLVFGGLHLIVWNMALDSEVTDPSTRLWSSLDDESVRAAFACADRYLVVAKQDGSVELWEVGSWKLLSSFRFGWTGRVLLGVADHTVVCCAGPAIYTLRIVD